MHNQRLSSCIVRIAAAALTMWFLASTASAVASVKPVVAEPSGPAGNFVELGLFRSSINLNPEVFSLGLDVNLQDVVGVTGVTITTGNGTVVPLFDDGGGRWILNQTFNSLAELITRSDGTWTIEVFGSSTSISTFTVSSASLIELDFFPTPTGLSPAHGDVGVSTLAVMSWNDPTGVANADAIAVCLIDVITDICDESIFGTMIVTDTSWVPPAPMIPGFAAFEVFYIVIDILRVGPLNVSSGTIIWGNSPFTPPGYPASTPLALRGSETIVSFTVGATCPADCAAGTPDGNVNVTDLLALLANWGGTPVLCDIAPPGGDGNVNVTDLLALLAAWGACP